MSELLKHGYNEEYILGLIHRLNEIHRDFDGQKFHQLVFDSAWPERELKQRMDHITRCLHQVLAMDYEQAIAILNQASVHFGGFEAMFFPHYVELYGQDNRPLSLDSLAHMTCYSSAEFAIRPFIQSDPEAIMAQMEVWASHENEHVRRLASEGCRPRLPWAMALPEFKRDPRLILPVLERLKQDPSLYVRRSVANNLNDIAKDNPQIVKDIAKSWLGQHRDTDWIVKHACRTLLKQADSEVLGLFGFTPVEGLTVSDFQCDPQLKIGDHLHFSAKLSHSVHTLGQLRLEYAIDYVKSNGKLSRKVFKIGESVYREKSKHISRKQSFKNMSTRKHYPGKHTLHVIVNGQTLATTSFDLQSE